MFFISKGPYYVVFNKNEIYWPVSFIDKLYSDSGLLSNRKFDLEDLYLNINQCILILMKNYIIWSSNLILLLLKKKTLLSKIQAVSPHESELFFPTFVTIFILS